MHQNEIIRCKAGVYVKPFRSVDFFNQSKDFLAKRRILHISRLDGDIELHITAHGMEVADTFAERAAAANVVGALHY